MKRYSSKLPPVSMFPNSKACEAFEILFQTLFWKEWQMVPCRCGKKGFCTPPHLVMLITIEPSLPRMCHDERFFNLWMKCPTVKFDPITYNLLTYRDISNNTIIRQSSTTR